MSITFPTNPSNGDTFAWGGITYTYDSTPGIWTGAASGSGGGGGSSALDNVSPLMFLRPGADGVQVASVSGQGTNFVDSGSLVTWSNSTDEMRLTAPSSGDGVLVGFYFGGTHSNGRTYGFFANGANTWFSLTRQGGVNTDSGFSGITTDYVQNTNRNYVNVSGGSRYSGYAFVASGENLEFDANIFSNDFCTFRYREI